MVAKSVVEEKAIKCLPLVAGRLQKGRDYVGPNKKRKKRFNPDWLTGVFTTIIAFISVAALIYAHLQLKEAHEESQVQHLLSLQQQYEQEPMVTYRKL